jgi:hypothetical protein
MASDPDAKQRAPAKLIFFCWVFSRFVFVALFTREEKVNACGNRPDSGNNVRPSPIQVLINFHLIWMLILP